MSARPVSGRPVRARRSYGRRHVGSFALSVLCAAALVGCARHELVHPDDVPAYRDSRWTVEHEPSVGAASARPDAGPPGAPSAPLPPNAPP